MTFTIGSSGPLKANGPGLRLDPIVAPLAVVAVGAFWALCHPYSGVVGDANLYIGRVVADLDPSGVGRDLMFVDDGQSKFSLFPLLAKPLVATLGVARASAVIAALASACWFLGLIALARGFASGRRLWAIVIAVAVLPVGYGDPGIFSFAETSALPRPFAEAAVMAALGALLGKRPYLAAVLLLLGVVLHPLMALPGVGVALVVAFWQMPKRVRLAILAGGALLTVVCAMLGRLGYPLFDRLFTVVDPDWMGMLFERSPHLFPTRWTGDAVAPIVAQATALLVAARTAPVPQRRLCLAVLLVGACGLFVAATLADHVHLLLFVQVQMWRATWLLAVVGGCAFAYCGPRLWERGNHGRLVLAGVAALWLVQIGPVFALVLAVLTLALEFGPAGASAPFMSTPSWLTGRVVACAYATFGALALLDYGEVLIGYMAYLPTYPVTLPHLVDPLRNNLQTLPFLTLTAVWLLKPASAGSRAPAALWGLGAVALVAIAGMVAGWDQRFAFRVAVESSNVPPGFSEMMAGRPQEVLWLDSRGEPWFMLGRPQYLSPQQAVGMVFSRPLAMEWRRRAQFLVDLGLAQKAIFVPADVPADDDRLHVTQAAIDTLCRHPDAPGAVFVPIRDGDPVLPLRDASLWTVPTPQYVYDRHTTSGGWRIIRRIAVVPCHPPSTIGPPPV